VRIENIATDTPIELLVYRPEYEAQPVTVAAADWKSQAGGPVAEIAVNLAKRPAPRDRK
jgi:hypothetical protein